jgi:hypothetical protein
LRIAHGSSAAVGGAADAITDGLLSPGALGIGIAGIVAAALLLLLLLVLRKKPKYEYDEEADRQVEESMEVSEFPLYISEYGLSDDLKTVVDDNDGSDLPRDALREALDFRSGDHNASEHNPDEEGFEDDLGETRL